MAGFHAQEWAASCLNVILVMKALRRSTCPYIQFHCKQHTTDANEESKANFCHLVAEM